MAQELKDKSVATINYEPLVNALDKLTITKLVQITVMEDVEEENESE